MMSTTYLRHLRRTLWPAAAALALATGAIAQTTTSTGNDVKELKEIVVTGSMLRRTDIETESPVTSFTAEQIQQSGLTTISDVVRTISADNSGTLPTAFGLGFAAPSANQPPRTSVPGAFRPPTQAFGHKLMLRSNNLAVGSVSVHEQQCRCA